MEIFTQYFAVIIDGLKMPFTVYGFTFSFWDLIVFSVIVSIIAGFVGRLLDLFA